MAGFTDLVAQAQPALFGKGVSASATEGRAWRWRFVDVNDNAGDPIDLSAATGVCRVITGVGGSEVIVLDFAGGVGEFSVSAEDPDTAGLASDGDGGRRVCAWSLVITASGDSVQVWGPTDSRFTILTED